MKNFLLFILLLCGLQYVHAQSVTAPAKPAFKLFFEKTYLHTDREYYGAGEDIWFKAYLLNGQSNQLFNSSNNLYVELISPNATIADSKLIRIDNGLGTGDFKLSDSIPSGTYRLRAYTNWMLNFGDNFIFEKELHIYNNIREATKAPVADTKKQTTNKNSTTATATAPATASQKTASLRFFPEGGSMIEGAAGVVAFKAADANGKGMMVKGGIYTSAGDKVTDFESNAYGLGSFLLLPEPGVKYEARGTYPNKGAFTIALPQALLKGFALTVRSSDSVIKISVNTNAATLQEMQNKSLKLQAKSKGETILSANVALKDVQTLVSIPRASLPQGVTALTFTDDSGKPQCERLVFNEKETANLTITPDKTTYGPKGKVTLHLVTTQNGAPVKANLSLAAVDAGLIPPNSGNIQSYLYLQSEIRGEIENPAQYFDMRNPQRKQQLDMLLLTQGWRDFVWKRLADSALRISYALEQGITVTGRVRGIWLNTPVPNINISLMADGAKGAKLFAAQSDAKGAYAIYGLNMYGNQNITISSLNKNGDQKGLILVDTTTRVPYPIKPVRVFVDSANSTRFQDDILKRMVIAKKLKFTDTTHLREVSITTLRIQRTQIDTTFKMTRNDYKLKTLYDYIVEKIPNSYGQYPNRVYFYGINAAGRYVKMPPVFTADNLQQAAWQIHAVDYYNLPLDQILEIHFRKITIAQLPNNNQGTLGFHRGDNFWIELKVKPHAFDAVDFHTSHFNVDGYYQARTFFAPQYNYPSTQPDYRTTIHWQPSIITELGEATITFFNADPVTHIRIMAEGLTDKGLPVSGVAEYVVK